MDPNNSNGEGKNNIAIGRGKPSKQRPWCWCEKTVLRVITETFAESSQAISARSLYLALCELASDNQSDTFTENKALIAHKAGLSVKTVERLLHGFEELALVRVDRNVSRTTSGSIKSANTYTLLAMRHGDATSMRHGSKQGSKSDKVEKSGTILEQTSEETRSDDRPRDAHGAPRTLSVPDGFDDEKEAVIRLYHEIVVASDSQWLPVNQFSERVQDAIAFWLADFNDSTVEDLKQLLFAVAQGDERLTIPKRRTLVRLLRENPPDSCSLEDYPTGGSQDDLEDEIPF
jgi:hypothetical protein